MKCPIGKREPWTVNWTAEKSGLPTIAAMSGVSKSVVSAVTTPPKAAPITTPTAISTTFPRRMNFLNPLSIMVGLPQFKCGQCKAGTAGGQGRYETVELLLDGRTAEGDCPDMLLLQNAPGSDAHRHNDVAVFVVVAFGGAELAGGLGVFQLKADF